MNVIVAETRKSIQQDLRYTLPRWTVVFVAITLIPQLMMFPQTGRGLWYVASLVLVGLCEGAIGGLVFVLMQRWWNPKDSRVIRIRNYVAALMIVGIGSLCAMTAIYS